MPLQRWSRFSAAYRLSSLVWIPWAAFVLSAWLTISFSASPAGILQTSISRVDSRYVDDADARTGRTPIKVGVTAERDLRLFVGLCFAAAGVCSGTEVALEAAPIVAKNTSRSARQPWDPRSAHAIPMPYPRLPISSCPEGSTVALRC